MDYLNDDIGKLMNKHGRVAVQKALRGKIGMNNKEIPPVGKMRALYNYYRALYPPSIPISYSYLRCDTALAQTGEIKFNVNETSAQPAILTTERRLRLNDTFEVSDVAIYLWMNVQAAGVYPLNQTRKLYTYVNPFIWGGAGEAAALESIYNSGRLAFKLGDKILFEGVDCLRFMRIPTTQEGQVLATTITTANAVTLYRAQRDGYTDAGYPFDDNVPALTLSGNGPNYYSIFLPESINMASPTATQLNYCTLWLRGFQCQNGALQKNKKFSVQ